MKRKTIAGGNYEYLPENGIDGEKEARKVAKELKVKLGEVKKASDIGDDDMKNLLFVVAKKLDVI